MTPAATSGSRTPWVVPVMLAVAVLGLWQFPRFWYTRTNPALERHWLAEQAEPPGWRFVAVPVSKAAESVLASDRIVNGEFTGPGGQVVRVFSAKRYSDGAGEHDMFAHTPDRCWSGVGFRLVPAEPEVVEVVLHGVRLLLERRIFEANGRRELVYFGALVGGQPLPYRLDQYRDVALRRAAPGAAGFGILGKAIGALDARLFLWPLRSFAERRPLTGPKQFVRVSTPLIAGDEAGADRRLRDFLPAWLRLADYAGELAQWRETRREGGSDARH